MKTPFRRLSFQAKLTLSFALVIGLTTLLGYWLIHQSVREAFVNYAVRPLTRQDQVLLQLIVLYYQRSGSIDAVVELLERSPQELPIALADPDGRIVTSPDERLRGRRLTSPQLAQGQTISVPGSGTWTLVPLRLIPWVDPLEAGFLRATRRSLWLAALTVGAVGIALGWILFRQLIGPLNRLDAATRRIADGQLNERVTIASSDVLGHLADSFNEMAESLENAEAAKRRMIADVSHELRTPITALRTTLEAMRDGLIVANEETFAALHTRVLLVTRLVNDLHQLALADAGALSIRRTPAQLEEIFAGILATIGVEIEDAGVRLDLDLDPNLPWIDADPQRIEQVLLNLLSNAIRHTSAGGTIRLAARRSDPGSIEVSVCDTGPGLAPSDLERVFDRFYRADAPRSSDRGGTGLGLAIAKAIVEAHGGRISAENRPEGGACFRFTLRTAASATGENERRGAPGSSAPRAG